MIDRLKADLQARLSALKSRLLESIPRRNKIEIPQEWLEGKEFYPSDKPRHIPDNLIPVISFKDFETQQRFVSTTLAIRRIVAFVLLLTSFASIIFTIRSRPLSLIITVPSCYILFDYLAITRDTGKKRVKWYILPDIEEKEVTSHVTAK